MKLFLRGLFALGLSAIITAAAFCDTPPVAAPAAAPAAGCSSCGGAVAGPVEHGRHGRRGFGHRIDSAADRYIGFNDRLGSCLSKLAGPPAEVSGGVHGGGSKGGPNTQPGTLVFPQHPFARSPRDFFMQD